MGGSAKLQIFKKIAAKKRKELENKLESTRELLDLQKSEVERLTKSQDDSILKIQGDLASSKNKKTSAAVLKRLQHAIAAKVSDAKVGKLEAKVKVLEVKVKELEKEVKTTTESKDFWLKLYKAKSSDAKAENEKTETCEYYSADW